jgi:PEP-CTERM motif
MRSSKFRWVLVSLAALVLPFVAPARAQAGYVATAYAPSVYDGNVKDLNAAVGISTGYAIENFESTTLLPNLSYTIGKQTFTSLPKTFSTSQTIKVGKLTLTPWQKAAWDGSNILVPNVGNSPTQLWQPITFNIAAGTTSFGIGISGVLLNTTGIYVNGMRIGNLDTLPGFQPGLGRNAYLIINAGPGDAPITSVGFGSVDPLDTRSYDHIAIKENPEPSTLALAGMSVLCLLGFGCWRRRRACP